MSFALWRVEDGLMGAAERLMRQALAKDIDLNGYRVGGHVVWRLGKLHQLLMD